MKNNFRIVSGKTHPIIKLKRLQTYEYGYSVSCYIKSIIYLRLLVSN